MAVKVKEKLNFFLQGFQLLEEVDQASDFWVHKVAGIIKTSIEVSSTEAGPIITSNHSIRIDHRNDIKVEGQKQSVGNRVVFQQRVDETLKHV